MMSRAGKGLGDEERTIKTGCRLGEKGAGGDSGRRGDHYEEV